VYPNESRLAGQSSHDRPDDDSVGNKSLLVLHPLQTEQFAHGGLLLDLLLVLRPLVAAFPSQSDSANPAVVEYAVGRLLPQSFVQLTVNTHDHRPFLKYVPDPPMHSDSNSLAFEQVQVAQPDAQPLPKLDHVVWLVPTIEFLKLDGKHFLQLDGFHRPP